MRKWKPLSFLLCNVKKQPTTFGPTTSGEIPVDRQTFERIDIAAATSARRDISGTGIRTAFRTDRPTAGVFLTETPRLKCCSGRCVPVAPDVSLYDQAVIWPR